MQIKILREKIEFFNFSPCTICYICSPCHRIGGTLHPNRIPSQDLATRTGEEIYYIYRDTKATNLGFRKGKTEPQYCWTKLLQ